MRRFIDEVPREMSDIASGYALFRCGGFSQPPHRNKLMERIIQVKSEPPLYRLMQPTGHRLSGPGKPFYPDLRE